MTNVVDRLGPQGFVYAVRLQLLHRVGTIHTTQSSFRQHLPRVVHSSSYRRRRERELLASLLTNRLPLPAVRQRPQLYVDTYKYFRVFHLVGTFLRRVPNLQLSPHLTYRTKHVFSGTFLWITG